ncbi:mannose-6-phosphate isomerase, class I [Terrimonas pollutisoli]|uniref:mannose-6-phosphate isomerase, class I n=1 Tax=Terrimonas pollutisoli TaxID=3034147 RepID=UPI0023EBEBB9|nr:mannose-6-phosphate isomerase, class I [Terrimonas sp. H1YJ31]
MYVIAPLAGAVKHYDWGGYNFIPSLLKQSNDQKLPFAEYWLGIHPGAECKVLLPDGDVRMLHDYFTTDSPTAMGEYVARHFGTMPYLLKALDVKDMLSIQVHPSKADAERDYKEETLKGIPLDSPKRNYKDENHKPELMVAMGDFWLLHGFKPEDKIKKTLKSVPELGSLLPVFEQSGYKGLYRKLMELPQEQVNAQLQPLLDRIIPLYQEGKLNRSQADYWAAKGSLSFSQPGKIDRGIFSVYLFNLVVLHRGEAIFQDAGVPHAYLEGQNVEIMASSDNVLRGGLTNKHIDVPELLKHVKCEATHPEILKGVKNGLELTYKTPAPDFELSSFTLHKGDSISFIPHTAEVILLIDGQTEISNKDSKVILEKGQPSAIVFPGHEIKVTANEPSWLFKATVPVN